MFSTDTERARRVAERLEEGMSNVNTPAWEGAISAGMTDPAPA